MRRGILSSFLVVGILSPVFGADNSSERFATASLPTHLAALDRNPADPQSHLYVAMIAQVLAAEQRSSVKAQRLQMMSDVSNALNQQGEESARLKSALDALEHEDVRVKENVWKTRCEEIRLERRLGHLTVAFDMALRLLLQDPSNQDVLREVSELQSAVQAQLHATGELSSVERYLLSGYYSFSQADYAEALAQWQKSRAVAALSPNAFTSELAQVSYYEKLAEGHLSDDRRRQTLAALFDRGVVYYRKANYVEALSTFRELAIQDPEYPELATYLVRSENAAEKDRTRRLSDQKRQEIAQRLEEGRSQLEKEHYSEAERSFTAVLAMDPTHPQARSYLALVQAELKKRNDPRGAQEHYEAGLVDYASGKLEDAVREWRTSIKLDAHHQKARNALVKAQKEMTLNREPL